MRSCTDERVLEVDLLLVVAEVTETTCGIEGAPTARVLERAKRRAKVLPLNHVFKR
jgi:hypothetical protein